MARPNVFGILSAAALLLSLATGAGLRIAAAADGDAAKGKALYAGKGGCVNCHGASGRGDGVAAMGLDPSPRDFRRHGFWRHRTEGEIFWVVKHGVAGTAMIPFGDLLSDEEIWAVIQYERSFAESSKAPGMGPRGEMEHRGPRGECCPGQQSF